MDFYKGVRYAENRPIEKLQLSWLRVIYQQI
jgi:hypothetical protein